MDDYGVRLVPGFDDPILGMSDNGADDDAGDSFPLTEKQAKVLKRRLKVAEKFRDEQFKPHYDASLSLYKGDQWKDRTRTDEARVTINIVKPMVTTKVATIGFAYPEFDLTAQNQAGMVKVTLLTAALRYEWRKAYVQEELVRCLQDKEIFSYGVAKICWRFETEQGFIREDGRETIAGEPVSMSDEEIIANVSAGKAPEAVQPQDVRYDGLCVKRLDPWNILISPEADQNLREMEFFGYWEDVPLEQIRADKRLKNTREIKGSATHLGGYLAKEDRETRASDFPTDIKRVRVYHYYEKRRKLYAMFCNEHDKPLLTSRWTWEFDDYPFEVIHAPKLESSFYAQTPVEDIESPQEELNETRTQLHNHRRRFTRKYQVARGLLDQTAKRQLKSAMDGTIVEHNGGQAGAVIFPIDHAAMAPEVYKSDEWAIRDMRMISGLDEYEMSDVGTTRRTAQEVQQIRSAGGSRAAHDAQQFERFCAAVARKCIALMQQYAVRMTELPLYGPNDDITGWETYTADDIKGEYLCEVYVGSTLPKSSVEQQQTYSFLLQSLAPYAQMVDPATGGPILNLKPLLKGMLSAFPEIRNVDEILAPSMPAAPPPVAGVEPGAAPAAGVPPAEPAGAAQSPDYLSQLAQQFAQGGQQ